MSTQNKQSNNKKTVTAIAERQAISITGTDYQLQARILWDDERPAAQLSVSVYDKDLLSSDDFLGETTTAENGGFELSFTEKDFKDLFFDHKPDLYFIIKDADGEELFNTKKSVIKNADEKTTPITLIL